LDYLITPPTEFGKEPIKTRDELLQTTFRETLTVLTQRLGRDQSKWQYGQATNKHIAIKHPLSALVSDEMRKKIDFAPLPRGGYGETVNSTSNSSNQTHGASFRMLMDTENWDKTLGINTPGQSADPYDPHYGDLYERWAKDEYFPVYFSKDKIKVVTDRTWMLVPGK
jgi:penicillin amidase